MTDIVFKKRSIKSRGHSTSTSKAKLNDSSDEDTVDLAALKDIKFEQSLRAKKSGASIAALAKGEKGEGAAPAEGGKSASVAAPSSSTLDTVLGAQFSGEASYGAQSVAHEKIMEQYINEKLGTGGDNKVATKALTEDDKLYIIPDEIKRGAVQTPSERDVAAALRTTNNEHDITSGASAGIAEVALPIKFKLKNIEETEAAERRMRDRERQNNKNSSSNFRFVQNFAGIEDRNHTLQEREREKRIAERNQQDSSNNEDRTNSNNGGGNNKRPKFSRDDQAMISFKKYDRARKH